MKIHLFALAAAIAVPVAAVASQAPAPIHDRMDGGDRPALVETRSELNGHVRTMFARLDADRDGFLTQAEARAGRPVRGDRLIRRNPAEANARHARAFDRSDLNRDGAISRAEWDARAAQRQQRRLTRAHERELNRHRMGGGAGGLGLRGHMFQMADVNRDNRVSFAEAQAAALRWFDRIDSNRDGRVTPDERRNNRRIMRTERRPG